MCGSVGGCWESALVRVTHWLPTLLHAPFLEAGLAVMLALYSTSLAIRGIYQEIDR